jgi:hypothetical protein
MRETILISGVVLLLIVLVTAWNFTGVIDWDGSCFRELRILVLDTSSQPIPGAKVAFVSWRWELVEKHRSAMEAYAGDEESLLHPSAETDAAGRCKLRAEFPASGTQTRFGGKRGSFGLAGQLDVERPGAQRVRIPLYELVGGTRYSIHHHSPIDVTVRLEAGTTRDRPDAAQ